MTCPDLGRGDPKQSLATIGDALAQVLRGMRCVNSSQTDAYGCLLLSKSAIAYWIAVTASMVDIARRDGELADSAKESCFVYSYELVMNVAWNIGAAVSKMAAERRAVARRARMSPALFFSLAEQRGLKTIEQGPHGAFIPIVTLGGVVYAVPDSALTSNEQLVFEWQELAA